MEEKGYKFYKQASKKSENNITRRTFDFLADQEILHIENIKDFYKELKGKGKFPSITLNDIKNNVFK